MFSGAFSASFAISRGEKGRFAAAFSSAFTAGLIAASYIGPMSAQAALVSGAESWAQGSALMIGGKKLIGPAGKVYAFASLQSMGVWRDNAIAAGLREAAIIAGLDAVTAAGWKAKKRAKLAIIAGRVVNAAGRQKDQAKRAALLAESDYCLSKWA